MPKLTAYQKILRAAKRGTGLTLNRDEVFYLSCDDAVRSVAEQDDTFGSMSKDEREHYHCYQESPAGFGGAVYVDLDHTDV